ncbi:MAG: lipopolysaccharide kinase InaA family protein [Planctomycetota bacterium]
METRFLDGARAGCADGAGEALAVLRAGESAAAPALVPPGELLEQLFDLAPEAFLRRMPGRETFAWPAGPGRSPRLVVKRFEGGERRDWWYERLRGPVRSPGRREGENLRALAADGFRVPRWVAWLEEPGALSWRRSRPGAGAARSALVMGWEPHRATLREALGDGDPAARRAWLDRLADLVARLHARGWYHRDLYLHQLLVGPDEELLLIDVGRARRERAPRRRWHVKDLAALLSSTPSTVTRAERMRVLGRYLETRGLAGERAAWARAVVRKARRIADHAPRHVDPDEDAA